MEKENTYPAIALVSLFVMCAGGALIISTSGDDNSLSGIAEPLTQKEKKMRNIGFAITAIALVSLIVSVKKIEKLPDAKSISK